jgi:gas vesicle protein
VGKSAEELRRDIEMTREDLGGTIEAIGDRVSPGRIIERRKNRFTNGVQSVRYRVMGRAGDAGHSMSDRAHSMTETVSDKAHSAGDTVTSIPQMAKSQTQGSPLAAGVVAFGAGFLAAAMFPPSERERHATEALMDKAQPLTEPLMEKLSESGHEMADSLKEEAGHAAQEVKQTAQESAAQVKDTAQHATHQDQPGMTGQPGFGTQDRGGA